MDLEEENKVLQEIFSTWQPPAPEVISRTARSVTLCWQFAKPFGFLGDQLLYKLEKREKTPPWVVVYSGGKTIKTIENLAPRHPHKFRLTVILKASAVNSLASSARKYYGHAEAVHEAMQEAMNVVVQETRNGTRNQANGTEAHQSRDNGTCSKNKKNEERTIREGARRPWLESRGSAETWTSTDSDGTSAVCFCMAVRCGYIKQLQAMLLERPQLVDIPCTSGLTPLATAIRKGDLHTVRFLVQAGAQVELPLGAGRSPLHLAALGGWPPIVDFLLERGADFRAKDINGLSVEHYAVDSCNLDIVKHILDKGGDVGVRDNNGWTPLFRAICQGASTEVIEELIERGSDVALTDRAGLELPAVARLLTDSNGGRRESVLRLVDAQFPHEKALALFTKLTKKISSVHSLLK